ncbi:MAG: hypothetical protein OXH99_25905 [Bryobacterales bacterium]|nr:hypothetical protein [Bryobacterales bacterium]
MPRPALLFALLLVLVATSPAVAQQREASVEVYGLSGVYSTGIEWAPFTPQAGAGVLLPIGRKWAALLDVSASVTRWDVLAPERNDLSSRTSAFYHRNPHLANEDEHWSKAATLRPSIVRIWRQDHMSFWLGAGLGVEWEHDRRRVRPILDVLDVDGNVIWESDDDIYPVLVREERFTGHEGWTDRMVLIGNFGVSVHLTPRVIFRLGYSCLMNDPDRPLAGSVETGVGYRF